ncbi:RHS repeat domain-containing protein [Anaeromyxobacter sp. SG66]|uniref:RHS repeat domain-containing protein n=1 Tax=Anaeromyxobacter sp. SG66 TaxID=2925410 RepID=UPI001F56FFFA|nr:RHS repeat-associated core domain-containing protein [Anaeromyxobacter sp. SG66]
MGPSARTNPDASRLVQRFLVDDFRSKGLLEREVVLDAQGATLVESLNQYEPELVGTPAGECLDRTPMNLRYPQDEYCAPTFMKLTASEKRLFEGEATAGVISRQVFGYDGAGNVSSFHDEGDVADPADDVFATVLYGPTQAAAIHCTGAPTEITVKNRSGGVLRYRRGVYDASCNLTELHSRIEGHGRGGGGALVVPRGLAVGRERREGHLAREPPGRRVLGGVPVRGAQRRPRGPHERRARLRLGGALRDPVAPDESTWTQDVNGQVTARAFDGFGRLTKVAAPGFTLDAPTIDISYDHTAKPAAAWAFTRNALPQGGTLDTVVVADGLGRVIQTKKTAEVWAGSDEATRVGWSVTGGQVFDAMGRVAEQGQPFFDPSMTPGYAPRPLERPTRFAYDALGRTIQTVEPNGAITRIAFAFGRAAGDPILRHQTTATDALGKTRAVYRDATEKTVAVEEHVEGRTPTTRYAYDPLGQLEHVTDAAGNVTHVKYDLLGRRTELDNPDAGRTVYGYDAAGNLIRREDANLRAEGKEIRYVYDFERLKEIRYPTSRRNVTYTYGPPGAPENGAARITKVEDELGEETRGYDGLGNLARSTRTVDPLRPGDRRRTYTTTFQLDVFGRMLSMVYPDGEVLTYGYDRGGLLKSARGDRPATAHAPAEYETYLQALLYDHFGQRVYQRVGNGVVTKYGYEPDTRRLATLYTRKPGERLLQNLFYSYDLVGNVLGVKNALGEAVPSHAGDVEFTYRYDDLHRLTYTHGEAKSRPSTLDTFTSVFKYSDIHNMTSNVQEHHVLHGPTGGGEYPPHTNHALEYGYGGKGPHQATRIGDASFVYDANGNTLRECRDPADSTCTQRPAHLRRYEWTEENRLDTVIDGGGRNATKFFYDADGQRVAKLGRGGESITIGQFWALKGRRAATKHVFAGTARIASKLLPPPGWDDVPRGPVDSTGTVVSTVGDVDNGCNPSNYQPQKCGVLPGGEPVLNDYYADAKVRPETYYYHPDHLGSTSWVTDQNGRVHEHVEYFPYGAVWRDPRSDVGASPVKGQRFLFTGKELDEETGLYYFGARYWDPSLARWKTPDPADRLTDLVPSALDPYQYARWSPLRFVDPSGRQEVTQEELDYYFSQHRVADTKTRETFAKMKPFAEAL